MLYELAITPDVFDGSLAAADPEHRNDLRELLREISVNGLIADLDKGEWARQIMACIDYWPASSRMDLMKYLSWLKDRNRLVRHPKRLAGHPARDQEWLGLAMESHRRVPFDWIVVSKQLRDEAADDCSALTELAGLRQSVGWENRRWSASVRMCESEYCQVLAPLLRHARRLEIVDPYVSYLNPRLFSIVEI